MKQTHFYAGWQGIVKNSGKPSPARRRLLDMGILPGTELKILHVAPFGGPCLLELRGYRLCLRQEDLAQIIMEDKTKHEHCIGGKSK